MVVEYPARLYALGVLAVIVGYGLGAGQEAVSIISGAIATMLLPGLLRRRSFAVQSEELNPGKAAPTDAGDLVALEVFEDAALVVSLNREVLAANTAARELLGDVLGEDIRLVMRHPGALDTVDIAIASGREVVRELEGLGGPGSAYRVRAAPIDDSRVLLNFVDHSQARASERMRADFVANASHELRTPLATVAGFIETLQGPAADDDRVRAKFLALMAEDTARMTRLIDDLLSLSRIELDKSLRPRSRTDLQQLVKEFRETVGVTAEAAGHELIVQGDAQLPEVLADRDQVFQVLRNLVSNAFKYGRQGAPVTLTLRRADRGVAISVKDEGEGISAEHIPRLTERFYRVDAGRSRRLGGTGLGLAIVKHIVERHRGKLEIRSKLGVGTVVSFTLPAAPHGQAESGKEEAAGETRTP